MYVAIGRRHAPATPPDDRASASQSTNAPRLRIDQFGYVLPTHNPVRVAEHAATLDHLLGGRLNRGRPRR